MFVFGWLLVRFDVFLRCFFCRVDLMFAWRWLGKEQRIMWVLVFNKWYQKSYKKCRLPVHHSDIYIENKEANVHSKTPSLSKTHCQKIC